MKKIALIIIQILLVKIGFTQNTESQIANLIEPYVKYDQFHGSILVAKNGEIIFNESYGFANMEWKIPNKPDTKYRIASISKQFTALIILQLVSEGKINLNGKITDYLKDYRKEIGDKVTIHQLLNHTSGIPNGDPTINGFWSTSEHTYIPYNKKEFIKKFCSGDLQFEPGSKFKYSSVGYIILGAIIEEVCKKPFKEVFQERIVDKIGLLNTTCDDNTSIVSNRSSGYIKVNLGWKNSSYHYMPILDGAGTILTTTEDLYKYDQALYTNDLLSKDFTLLFFKPNDIDGSSSYFFDGSYSYGWNISHLRLNSSDSIKIISHGGGIRGGSGFFARQVDKKNTVIILSNTEIGSLILTEIGLDIVRILNNEKTISKVKIPVKQIIGQEIVKSGIDSAIIKYHEIRKTYSEIFDLSENQLNSLGNSLLGRGMIDEALRIFILNIEIFPEYANGYSSLGEVYMKKGIPESAIKNYKKSLELNPNNENAREMLIKIQAK